MSYKLSAGFDIAQQERARFILEESARTRSTPSETMNRLFVEGVSYRKTNMLEDYARAQTVSASKSIEALGRAENFFENTLAPFQTASWGTKEEPKKGLTWGQLGEIMTAYKGEYELPDELAKEAANYAEWIEEHGT
jgi:hypothetical protein